MKNQIELRYEPRPRREGEPTGAAEIVVLSLGSAFVLAAFVIGLVEFGRIMLR